MFLSRLVKAPGGGFNPTSEQYPAGTVIVLRSHHDVSASKDQAAALGAKIIQDEMPIPVGTMVFFPRPDRQHDCVVAAGSAGM